MASLRKESDRGRSGWRLQLRHGGRRCSLWLGDLSKRAADAVARHIDELARAAGANVAPSSEATVWANGVDDRIYASLVKWQLAETRISINADSRFCETFFRAYVADRSDLSPITITNYGQAIRWFGKRFKADRLLSSITANEFESWHRWMVKSGLAPASANKHAKRIRTLFGKAIKARLLLENPGTGYGIGGEVCRDRDHYITRTDAVAILGHCDTEWALIFGLCRFAGFRCPTEVIGLKWSDVQWAENRLRVESQKTGLRFCPIFPELRPLLDAAWEAAPEGATFCIGRHRDTQSNLRTHLVRIIERSGLTPWAKPFVNLRASCRTDLEERFPSHAIDAWMGHSTRIARKHCLQVTDAHWEKAASESDPSSPKVTATVGGVTGGVIPAHPRASEAILPKLESSKTPCLIGTDVPGGETAYPRQGSNLWPQL